MARLADFKSTLHSCLEDSYAFTMVGFFFLRQGTIVTGDMGCSVGWAQYAVVPATLEAKYRRHWNLGDGITNLPHTISKWYFYVRISTSRHHAPPVTTSIFKEWM